MSRCILDDEKRGFEVVIGWDPPLESFFARVASGDREIFWTGNGDKIYRSPEALVEMIQPYACKHDKEDLIRELWLDKANDDGERRYDLCSKPPDDIELPDGWSIESIVVKKAPGEDKAGARAKSTMEWQEKAGSEVVSDEIVVLWTGEVLLDREPGGMSSPFCATEESAKTWAIEASQGLLEEDICGAQLVKWHCAKTFAERVLAGGEEEYKRLNRFWISPIRSQAVTPVEAPEY
jgi:hypothetical protein